MSLRRVFRGAIDIELQKFIPLLVWHFIRLLRHGGERPIPHGVYILLYTLVRFGSHLSEPPNELGLVPAPRAQSIVTHENLTRARRARADPNSRNVEFAGDVACEGVGNGFEDDGERAGGLESAGIGQESERRVCVAALDAVARKRGVSLGEKTDVRHDGDPEGSEPADDGDDLASPLELHRFHPALLHEPHGVANAVLGRWVRPKRHVGDEERRGGPARDGLAVVDHLGERKAGRRGIPEAHLGETIADEADVDVISLRPLRRRVIVRGKDGNRGILGAKRIKALNRDFFAGCSYKNEVM